MAAAVAAFYACYKCTTSSTTKLAWKDGRTDNPAVGRTEPAHHKGRAVGQLGLAASSRALSRLAAAGQQRESEEEQVQHNKAKPYTQRK